MKRFGKIRSRIYSREIIPASKSSSLKHIASSKGLKIILDSGYHEYATILVIHKGGGGGLNTKRMQSRAGIVRVIKQQARPTNKQPSGKKSKRGGGIHQYGIG